MKKGSLYALLSWEKAYETWYLLLAASACFVIDAQYQKQARLRTLRIMLQIKPHRLYNSKAFDDYKDLSSICRKILFLQHLQLDENEDYTII